jgi:hypothetical protein
MVHHIQNYRVFALFPSSGILGTREHDVSETGSVSVLRCGGEDIYSVGSITQSYLNLLVPRIPGDRKSPKTQ